MIECDVLYIKVENGVITVWDEDERFELKSDGMVIERDDVKMRIISDNTLKIEESVVVSIEDDNGYIEIS